MEAALAQYRRQQRATTCPTMGNGILDESTWILMAHRKGMLLRPRNAVHMMPGRPLLVVPIDQAIRSHADQTDDEGTPVMSASAFFGPFVQIVVPTGRARLLLDTRTLTRITAQVPVACLASAWNAPPRIVTQIEWADWGMPALCENTTHSPAWTDNAQSHRDAPCVQDRLGQRTLWASAAAGRPDFRLSAGTQDGWTRYMLWQDVLTMPDLYIRPGSLEEQESDQWAAPGTVQLTLSTTIGDITEQDPPCTRIPHNTPNGSVPCVNNNNNNDNNRARAPEPTGDPMVCREMARLMLAVRDQLERDGLGQMPPPHITPIRVTDGGFRRGQEHNVLEQGVSPLGRIDIALPWLSPTERPGGSLAPVPFALD